ncbi:MAG: HAMP domain-containing protein [Acidiferrobacterales bacterium]|nr:HAMP domain-containing protein [Acidiferrobacterales bacterium]
MNIRTKIILGAALGSLISVGAVAYLIASVSEKAARESLTELSQNSLVSIRNSRQEQVESYFKTIRGQLATYSNNRMIINAAKDFSREFANIGAESEQNLGETVTTVNDYRSLQDYYNGVFSDRFQETNVGEDPNASSYFDRLDERARRLQSLYISDNINPLGQKDLLTRAPGNERYSVFHERYHPFVRSYLLEFGYYDIFIVNNEGDVVYSVFKEIDYATNLISGAFASSGLGDAFRASAPNDIEPDAVQVIDFDEYFPSYNDPAAFFSSPIYDGSQKVGVLVMQAPVDRLNDLMTSNGNWKEVGLGDSGETYIVADDNTLRNDSRFLIEDKANYLEALRVAAEPNLTSINARGTSIGLQSANTKGTKDALLGNAGFDIFPDYRNIRVLSAYTPLDIPGLKWVLMSEIDEEEAFRSVENVRNTILKNTGLIGLGALALIGIGAALLVRSITRPLQTLVGTIGKVTEGDLTARAELTSGDELEDLGNAFDTMLDERVQTMAQAEKDNTALNESVVSLMEATSQLADRDLTVKIPVAEDVTGSVSDALNLMVEETSDVLLQISNISKQVEDSSNLVQSHTNSVKTAAQSEQTIIQNTLRQLETVSTSMQGIAGLVQTINGLAGNVQESTEATAQTVTRNIDGMGQIRETVSETEKRIKRLAERSQEISGIVDIINTLSERTHVLALNASMQAASAGEAGKGFAVVADEVQRLAESSRESTQEISSLVDSIQLETSEAMSTMNVTISRVVEGTDLAGQAGVEMHKAQSDAAELGLAIQKISEESTAQEKANSQLKSQANKVLQSTEATGRAVEEQAVETTKLVDYATKLRAMVQSFKLSA